MDVRTYRLRERLTLSDLAAKVQVTPATVSRWERNLARPTLCAIERIVTATGGDVRAEDFLPSSRVTAQAIPFGCYGSRGKAPKKP